MGHRASVGFTLVELMVAVTVTAVLAAIAIPFVADLELRAKRAELIPLVDGILDAAKAYHTASGDWPVAAPWHPPVTSSGTRRPWLPMEGPWAELGFAPDGMVYGSYAYGEVMWDLESPYWVFGAKGTTDLDGDSEFYAWQSAWAWEIEQGSTAQMCMLGPTIARDGDCF